MKIRIQSEGRLSNRMYHACGKPDWWARIGQGDSAQFLDIGEERGDRMLDVVVDVPDHADTIHIGTGPRNLYKRNDGIRETIRIERSK